MKSFYEKYPDLLKYWNYRKNNPLKPEDVPYGSSQEVWWICNRGHDFKKRVYSIKTSKCPYCSNQKVCYENSLARNKPEIAKQWHPSKNKMNPFGVTSGSGSEAWWICEKKHEFKMVIKDKKLNSCPVCNNKIVVYEDSLEVKKPDIAKQWHPTKNKKLPSEVSANYTKNCWWICISGHEFKQSPKNRTNLYLGCRQCSSQFKTSFNEQAIFYYVKQHFRDAENRYKFNQIEIDVFIPSLQLGIEYDGYYHIKNKVKDIEKNNKLKLSDIILWRFRGHELQGVDVGNICYQLKNNSTDELNKKLKLLMADLFNYANVNHITLDIDVRRDSIKIQQQYISQILENNFLSIKPHLEEEWDTENNGLLRPRYFPYGSNNKAWWICVVCKERWQSTIVNRVKGNGCPYCSNKKVTYMNSLGYNHPELIKQWDNEKNKKTIFNYVPGSNHKAWWICEKGHSYQQQICKKIKTPTCRECFKIENSLAAKFPNILRMWDYGKNDLSPYIVSYGSGKKAWWKCDQGHFWEERICKITLSKQRCPYCSNRRILKENSLAANNPRLTMEWDLEGNIKSPLEVSPRSSYTATWKCLKCSYRYSARVDQRNKKKGSGCPRCSGRVPKKYNLLINSLPELIKHWDYKKNKKVDILKISIHSQQKVFWKCNICGNEEYTAIRNKVRRKSPCNLCEK
ncbi:zinc-ribbon domain-containing protein [Bacillus shivajii]|uniref:zinc-ribbon domain-containing protein n=1 Tax=Bacillus shivajii TaxID=1983719 RepID=UPI001CFBBE1E|nr:zinc-ribbon domain-containing protein [Bacillus shivajii]UCZ53742.1 zinc-ribbon domain-containing protein [Bacillus shivajii]